jgi:prophage regulatory protein
MASVNKMILVMPIGGDPGVSYLPGLADRFLSSRTRMLKDNLRLAISNGFPEQGGGGASADVDCEGGDSSGAAPEVAASDDDDGGDDDGEPARRSSRKKHLPSGKHRNVTATAGALLVPQNPDIALWRLPTVLAHIPVSRSGWWAGVKTGRYPQPVKLSTRCVAWRSQDIAALIASF